MKKIVLLLSLFVATQSFAAEVKVSSAVRHSFEARFNRAKEVSWSEKNEFVIASFTQYGKKLSAYFNHNGDLVVVAEAISLQMLPQDLFAQLVEDHANHNISEVFKMKNDEGVQYHAVLENNKEKLFLKSLGEEWVITKTIKK